MLYPTIPLFAELGKNIEATLIDKNYLKGFVESVQWNLGREQMNQSQSRQKTISLQNT